MSKKQEIDLLAERSSGAYSYPAYRNWRGVCAMLLRRGFSPREANAILLSKWTRWAGDGSKTRRYGNYTSTDLAAFLDCMGHEEAKKEAAQMADETPSDYDTPEVSEIDRLRATNAELLAALKSLLAYDADDADQPLPGTREAEVIAAARAASANAEGQS